LHFQSFLFLVDIVYSVLPFFLAIAFSVLQCPRENERTENAMAKRKRKNWKYNGQEKKEGLKIQWPRKNGGTNNWIAEALYFQFFLFLLAIAFSVLPFSLGHCIFSPSLFSWPLYF
jgi:hypothetical protein